MQCYFALSLPKYEIKCFTQILFTNKFKHARTNSINLVINKIYRFIPLCPNKIKTKSVMYFRAIARPELRPSNTSIKCN